jgi:hypothetical protein
MKIFAAPFLAILIMASLGLLLSCNDNEEKANPPSIEFVDVYGYISSDTQAGPAASLKFKINCSSNGSHVLTNFIVSSNGSRVVDEGINTHNLQRDIELTKNSDAIEVIVFTIRDIVGGETSISVSIELDETIGDTEPIWYNNITLNAQAITNAKSFLSLSDGQTKTLQEAIENQSSINLLYYFDTLDADEKTISSPGANIDNSIFPLSTWTTRNTTRFISNPMSLNDFEAINSVMFLVDSYNISGNRKAKNLKVGDTYSFKDEARNKVGMFRVYSIEGEATGQVVISVVIQP